MSETTYEHPLCSAISETWKCF